jgi:hypothetical protein
MEQKEKKEPTQRRLKTKGQNKAFASKNTINRFKGYEIDFNKISSEFEDLIETDEFRDYTNEQDT